MPSVVSCLIPSAEPRQEPFGDPLLDAYLEFLSGRCRPNSVLAARFDLKVFFAVVAKPVEAVTATDVLGFITAQRSGATHLPDPLLGPVAGDTVGVSLRTVRRRLSTVAGLVRVPDRPRRRARQPGPARAADPPGTSPAGPGCAVGPGAATDVAADPDPGRGRRADRPRCAPTGTGPWSPRCCSAGCGAARSSGCGWRMSGPRSGGCSSPRARAATNDSCRSPRGSSSTWAPTSSRSGPRTPTPTRCSSCSNAPGAVGR